MPAITFSQTSLLQDKSGETSIILSDKKTILVNAGDGSVSANLSFNKPGWFIGSNLKVKSTEGVSNILDGYKFKPEFDFGVFGGNTITGGESVIQYVFYGLKFNATNFNLLNKDSSNTFSEKNFYGGTFSVGYNRIGSINILKPAGGIASSCIYGVAADYSLINNLDDLKSVQSYTTFTKDTGSTTTTLLSDKKSGFAGEYSTFGAVRLNIDAYIYPQIIGGQIGFGGYTRSRLSGKNPKTNAGAGFIVGERDAPTNVVFGILYQFDDVFNQLKEENDIIKRGGINVIAGYSF
jgi:hypothetical protein